MDVVSTRVTRAGDTDRAGGELQAGHGHEPSCAIVSEDVAVGARKRIDCTEMATCEVKFVDYAS